MFIVRIIITKLYNYNMRLYSQLRRRLLAISRKKRIILSNHMIQKIIRQISHGIKSQYNMTDELPFSSPILKREIGYYNPN